jgi:hypothetical protein
MLVSNKPPNTALAAAAVCSPARPNAPDTIPSQRSPGEDQEQITIRTVLQHLTQSIGDMIGAGFFTVEFGDRTGHIKGGKGDAMRDVLANLQETPWDIESPGGAALQFPQLDEEVQDIDRRGDCLHARGQRIRDRISS